MSKKVVAIVAVDEKWGIGKKNGLLFKLPLDMKYFREQTTGKTVCMGYNTLLSFPGSKPLADRKNIVLCPNDAVRDDLICVHSFDDMKKAIAKEDGDVFVIGGAMFYRSMLPYCDKVLVTKVAADGGAEVFFENLDKLDNFTMVKESEELETNGYQIKFTVYKNTAKEEL